MNVHAPIADLPRPDAEPRILASEVCAIARYSKVTLRRRIAAGKLPKPVDRGEEAIFDRRAVYLALGIELESGNHAVTNTPEQDPWLRGAHALLDRPAAPIRRSQSTRRRHPFLLSSPGAVKA